MSRGRRLFSEWLLLSLVVTGSASADIVGLDDWVSTTMRERSIPGLSLVVLRDGAMVHEGVYGRASLELDVPVTSRTVFALASVTKVFTATLVLQQVQSGALGLDERLGDLLADVPQAWRPVTVRQMLAHTSGLPDVIVDPMKGTWLGASRDESLSRAAALPMQFDPGTAWSYNQTNYVLLASILERRTGKAIAALVAESIFEPLELQATRWGDARRVVPGRGPWYSRLDTSGPQPRLATEVHPMWVEYPEFTHPCAGLNSTALELARFVDRLAAGQILARATVEAMWQAQTLQNGAPAGPDPASRMGLGWIVEDLDGRRMVGGSGGASVAFRHAVDDRVTVVVLTNCQGSDPDGIATEVLRRALGGKTGAPRR